MEKVSESINDNCNHFHPEIKQYHPTIHGTGAYVPTNEDPYKKWFPHVSWLVVWTHLKNISPQVGMTIKNVWVATT